MKRLFRIGYVATVAVSVVALKAAGLADDAPTFGDKVVRFCKANLGEKVGNGQCGTLAGRALKEAGAKQARDFEESHKPLDCPICGKTHKGGLAEFVFGKLVYSREAAPERTKEVGKLSDIRPGDIIQFRHAKFANSGYSHHTAIVSEIDDQSIKVYHQNVTPKQVVVQGAIRPNTLSKGWIRIYRPVPK